MNAQNQAKSFLFFSKYIFLLFFVMVLLQGCQGEIPSDASVDIIMETKTDGKPYLSLVDKNNSRVFKLNGFYEMEDLIPDLAFEKELIVAGNTYIISSLFGQVIKAETDLSDKKFYEYYLEVYDAERTLVELSYIHRESETDWSTVFNKSFSQLNQEGYCLLTFEEKQSGINCIVRGSYNLFCRSGERTEDNDSYQAIAITKTRLMIGNKEYIEGARVLTGVDGGKHIIKAKIVDWNMDGNFDDNDRVVFTNFAEGEYYPLGEEIEIPPIDLITSSFPNETTASARYLLHLSPAPSEYDYILSIKSMR